MSKVLIISENESGVIVNSLYQEMEKRGIDVKKIGFGTEGMASYIADTSLILLVIGDDTDVHSQVFANIKKYCYDYHKYVAIHAIKNQIDEIEQVFPGSLIAEVFVRPVEKEEVIDRVNATMTRIESAGRQKNILVVDDSGPMLRTIHGWLKDRYAVSLANSAASAFTAIEKNKPDMILLDYEMPICSGAQFLEMLRAEDATKNIPVIFLTARGDAETVKMLLTLRPDGYILKTTPGDKVIEKMEMVFAMKEK